MYKELNNKKFDAFILGTSLSESVVSSFLSKNGKKILHLDVNKSYGGDCKNMNFIEFNRFSKNLPNSKSNIEIKDNNDNPLNSNKNNNDTTYLNELCFPNLKLIDLTDNLTEKENLRNYNFDFNLKLLYSKSIATEELSHSKASNYLTFLPILVFSLFYKGMKINVPTSKSEIFLSEELDLQEKQRLFNFLMAVNKLKPIEDDLNAVDDFKKNSEVENIFIKNITDNYDADIDEFLEKYFNEKLRLIIKYVLGCFSMNSDSNINDKKNSNNKNDISNTVRGLVNNVHKYMSSVNVFSKSPFLYPIYGSSEFSQAMCRMGSIFGAIFIINNSMKISISKNPEYKEEVDAVNYKEKKDEEEQPKDGEINKKSEDKEVNEDKCNNKYMIIIHDQGKQLIIMKYIYVFIISSLY